jgi:hypothetical protein
MRAAGAKIVGEKHEVEFGPLGGLRDLGVMREVHAGVGLRVGMAPRCDMMAGRIEEGPEPHLALASAHDDVLAWITVAKRRCDGTKAAT